MNKKEGKSLCGFLPSFYLYTNAIFLSISSRNILGNILKDGIPNI
jgi:hypothetical protein